LGAIVQREDCSIEQALDLAKETKLDSGVVRAIVQREDYTFEQALDLAKKLDITTMLFKQLIVPLCVRLIRCYSHCSKERFSVARLKWHDYINRAIFYY
jgi:hypothetical protein